MAARDQQTTTYNPKLYINQSQTQPVQYQYVHPYYQFPAAPSPYILHPRHVIPQHYSPQPLCPQPILNHLQPIPTNVPPQSHRLTVPSELPTRTSPPNPFVNNSKRTQNPNPSPNADSNSPPTPTLTSNSSPQQIIIPLSPPTQIPTPKVETQKTDTAPSSPPALSTPSIGEPVEKENITAQKVEPFRSNSEPVFGLSTRSHHAAPSYPLPKTPPRKKKLSKSITVPVAAVIVKEEQEQERNEKKRETVAYSAEPVCQVISQKKCGAHVHSFRPYKFKVPTICSVCNKFIHGFGFQGCICLDPECNFKAHKECSINSNGRADPVRDSKLTPEEYEKKISDLNKQLEQQQQQLHNNMNININHIKNSQQNTVSLGSYEISRKDIRFGHLLGSGACGEVFHGLLHGVEVAVKVLALNHEQTEAVAQTFHHEVGMLMKLRHPNIVLFMGASTESNQFLIVTEFTEHGSLHDVLHRNKSPHLSWQLRLQIAEHTALGMNWLHNQKPQILHRDLKTANILVDRNLNAKLCDFGIAKVFENLGADTGFYGSPVYSAPENLLHQPYNDKVDCFSFSYVMWELVTNQIPYLGMFTSFEELVECVVKKGHRPPIPSTCPERIVVVISRAWSPNPRERPSFQSLLDSKVFRDPQVLQTDPFA